MKQANAEQKEIAASALENAKQLELQIEKMLEEQKLVELLRETEQEQQRNEKFITLVKNTHDPDTGKTYGDTVQSAINDGAKRNIQYKWDVTEKAEYGTYLVSFVDTVEKRGFFWEVNPSTSIVRYVSNNWMLKIQYGLTPLKHDKAFTIREVKSEEITVPSSGYYYGDGGIVYKISASVRNNTGKNITSCSLDASLIVVYSEQKIIETSASKLSFSKPSPSDPWRPNRVKEFTLYTKPYDYIYKEYNPLVALCYLFIAAEDPLGYEYSGAFEERKITKLFEKLD